jgi:spore coat protein A
MHARFPGSNPGIGKRRFLQLTAGAAAYLASTARGWPFSQSPLGVRKFTQPLRGLGSSGIPVATKTTSGGMDSYNIEVAEFRDALHPDLYAGSSNAGTKFWGYADNGGAHRYLGGIVVANRGTPTLLTVTNRLPNYHPLPVDTTIMGAEPGVQVNRIVTHLHGGFTPWNSDGGPFAWFSPDQRGPSFLNGTYQGGAGVPGRAQFYYPNDQSARLMWYHDHAVGITRLNAYAGIASAYVLKDAIENGLIAGGLIPGNLGATDLPLVIQDKTFFDPSDPRNKNYPVAGAQKGDLWYPFKYEANSLPDGSGRWDYGPDIVPGFPFLRPLPTPSCVPEFFADTTLVNGVPYPFLPVQQRHYRFRILNASQARFYNLQLYFAKSNDAGEADLTKPGPDFIQIGTEGGFLPIPVRFKHHPFPTDAQGNLLVDPATGNVIGYNTAYNLALGPAERADIVIDFSNLKVGDTLILYSDAPAPYPGPDPRNDYFTGDLDQTGVGGAPSTQSGMGPNTRTLMQFKVVQSTGAADPPQMNLLQAFAVPNTGYEQLSSSVPANPMPQTTRPTEAVRIRNLTLNEDFDEYGRLIQREGTTEPAIPNSDGTIGFGRAYTDPPTEVPAAGDVEIWRIFNLTGDTHPIHFHLVNVHVLSRQAFNPGAFLANPGNPDASLIGSVRGPDANEWGAKETVRMHPAECTTVIIKFDLPNVPFTVPSSPRFPGIAGANEYVWHCHILEHEEHDMMRPLIVTRKKATA